jgi:acetyl esterase/lipase
LTGQYLSIPAVCNPEALPAKYKDMYLSRKQNKDALILNQTALDIFDGNLPYHDEIAILTFLTCFVDNYKNDSLSPLRSPLIFPSHKDLPPAYFQVCGADPLRDEGLIYEMVLREDCGIETKLDIFPGLPHGFWTWWPTAKFGVDLQEKSVEGLKWLLEKSK